ncbi:MAG: SPFH domain-containing protein [Acetatifactor sp.]|nr:SPFH domain-containing protein [Acetatifactor sp.]
MGLLKAAKDALGGLMADQWREYFYCDSMNSDTLMVKGEKQVTQGRNSNTKGNDNIISNGSIISVNVGQCMIIVDQGKIAEFCAEPGEFVYDTSSEPSLLYGNLGENIKNSFIQFGRRFTFGGNTAKDQRVYYINTKEIMDNLYGTPTPIPFHLVSKNTGFELETTVKCNGTYTFKIVDPILFYSNVAGNVVDRYDKKDKLQGIMKAELLTKLPIALSQIAAEGVLPYQVPLHLEELTNYLKEGLTAQWTELRGIEVVSMTMAAPIVPQEDMDKINKWNDTAVLTNASMAEAKKTEAFAKALGNMGGNGEEGTGSAVNGAMGMMGMAMMQNMMNNGMGNMFGTSQQAPQMRPASTVAEGAVLGWTCSCGRGDNRGKFCQECGLPKPALDGWTCSCGHVNQGKFCQECGRRKPEGAPLYRCDKCGWQPEDPAHPPKFCPECGDIFDENDRI